MQEIKKTSINVEDLEIRKTLKQGIIAQGYEKIPESYKKLIELLLQNKELIIKRKDGDMYYLPLGIAALQKISPDKTQIQSLILCPTREHAYNLHGFLKSIANFEEIKIEIFVGGTRLIESKRILDEGVDLVSGTPGRISDFVKRGWLDLTQLKCLYFYEYDVIVGGGYQESIENIVQEVKKEVQICAFNYDESSEINKAVIKFINDPIILGDSFWKEEYAASKNTNLKIE